MPTDAMVSNLRWPYGWSSSGGALAARTPMIATMFEAVSVREWKPSDSTETAPVVRPSDDLRGGDEEIEKENAVEDGRDAGRAGR